MKSERSITDTTLLSFSKAISPKDRLLWAKRLRDTGIHEVVLPLTNRKEAEAYRAVIGDDVPAFYVRMDPAQLQKALRYNIRSIHLEIPVSYPMIYTVYKNNKDWARNTLLACKDLLMDHDVSVTLVLADASRAEPCFLESLVQHTVGLTINKLIAKDMMGIQTLSACSELVGSMLEFGYDVGYEGSNQFGLSLPNTIQALRTGALHASCCLGGLGNGCDLRWLLQTTNRTFSYGINRKGAEHLDRTFKSAYRAERLLRRKNNRFGDCGFHSK